MIQQTRYDAITSTAGMHSFFAINKKTEKFFAVNQFFISHKLCIDVFILIMKTMKEESRWDFVFTRMFTNIRSIILFCVKMKLYKIDQNKLLGLRLISRNLELNQSLGNIWKIQRTCNLLFFHSIGFLFSEKRLQKWRHVKKRVGRQQER